MQALRKKEGFVTGMRRFNKQTGSDWLAGEKDSKLRMLVYSCCYQLEGYIADHAEDGFSLMIKG
ncbi:MAG: hypothetical protein JRM87_05045, partial [Nitrososphaerota archaeon]|nr:hypothetical protein [Nitrososphaerota archaeon]